MKNMTVSSQLFGTYFHQDWTDEFRSDAEAVQAMVESEPPEVIIEASREVHKLLVADMNEADLAAVMMDEVGCYYNPALKGETYREWLGSILNRWKADAE